MGGYESDVVETLTDEFYQLLDTAERHAAILRRKIEAAEASSHPKRQQQLVLLGIQLKAAETLVRLLNEQAMDLVIQMVDLANGPWDRRQFLEDEEEDARKAGHK